MPKVNEITVRCENRPGALEQIATVMGDVKVNILGFLLTTSGARGWVKLVVDDVEKAKEALDDAGLPYAPSQPFFETPWKEPITWQR